MIPQKVIVTAGASGIGLAIVQQFLHQGAQVTTCDIDQQTLDACVGPTPPAMCRRWKPAWPEEVKPPVPPKGRG